MLDKQEVISIISSFNTKADFGKNDSDVASLARCSKQERRQHIRNTANVPFQVISAAIEISRAWKGYICRKKLLASKQNNPVTISNNPTQSPEERQERIPSPIREPLLTQETGEDKDLTINLSDTIRPKAELPVKTTDAVEPGDQQLKKATSKPDAAIAIQRAWRRHIDMQVFRYYRDLINFRGQGDPAMMLRCINPNEAKLLDAAAGIHVRFRLAGEKFPPNIYYKIYTHRSVVDMCANSPKDYTKAGVKQISAKQMHNKKLPSNPGVDSKEGWYRRYENNGWRLVSDRLIYASMDSTTWETSRKQVEFHHVKLQRKADVEQRRRRRKIEWMKKMYKDGMLKSKEPDQDTKELVEKAARGLVNTVNVQGVDAVMDWEVDELLQWTTALNFDDYLEVWKESATSTLSELEASNLKQSSGMRAIDAGGRAVSVNFDPYSLTRASSMGLQRSRQADANGRSTSQQRLESRLLGSGETQLSDLKKDLSGQKQISTRETAN